MSLSSSLNCFSVTALHDVTSITCMVCHKVTSDSFNDSINYSVYWALKEPKSIMVTLACYVISLMFFLLNVVWFNATYCRRHTASIKEFHFWSNVPTKLFPKTPDIVLPNVRHVFVFFSLCNNVHKLKHTIQKSEKLCCILS